MNQIDRAKNITVLFLFILIFIDTLGIGMVWPLFGPLFMDINTSILPIQTNTFTRDILYGITIGIFPFCMFFSTPTLGYLSDNFGRKIIILCCLLGTGIGMLICFAGVFFHFFLFLLFGRGLLGILAGNQSVAQACIIDISTSNKKSIYLSFITLAVNAGFATGPILGGLFSDKNLVSWFDNKIPFLVAGVLAFLNFIYFYFFFNDIRPRKKSYNLNITKNIFVFKLIFKNPKTQLIAVIYLFSQISWALYFQFSIINFVQTYNYSGTKLSYFISTLYVAFAFSLLIILRVLVRFFSSGKIANWAILGSIISLACSVIGGQILLWIIMIPTTFCMAITNNTLLTLLSNSTSHESQGQAMGVAGALNAVAIASGAILAGFFGTCQNLSPFLISAILMVTNLVIFIYGKHYNKYFKLILS